MIPRSVSKSSITFFNLSSPPCPSTKHTVYQAAALLLVALKPSQSFCYSYKSQPVFLSVQMVFLSVTVSPSLQGLPCRHECFSEEHGSRAAA